MHQWSGIDVLPVLGVASSQIPAEFWQSIVYHKVWKIFAVHYPSFINYFDNQFHWGKSQQKHSFLSSGYLYLPSWPLISRIDLHDFLFLFSSADRNFCFTFCTFRNSRLVFVKQLFSSGRQTGSSILTPVGERFRHLYVLLIEFSHIGTFKLFHRTSCLVPSQVSTQVEAYGSHIWNKIK